MRSRVAIWLASAAVVIATPATAKDDTVYFGAELGAMKANDTDVDVNGVEDVVQIDYEFDLPDDAGWDGGLLLGYDFGGFRLEAEGSLKEARIEQYTSTIAFPGGAPAGTRLAAGSTDVMAFMLNAMGDFGDDEGISAFVGGGVGWAKVDIDGFGAFANQPAFLDDSDSGFAWQLFAGLRSALSDNVDMHVKYRYFNAGNVNISTGANDADLDFSSHSVLGGITFNFGGSEPPPPPPAPVRVAPPPPPPPPPAPAMRNCPDGSRVLATQACPVPPPPPVVPTGERG